ncbi:MAG: YceI family protein [Bacteroidetes bacterium]|nr:MAG: YceI family protein [Bacteroidota bacterium]
MKTKLFVALLIGLGTVACSGGEHDEPENNQEQEQEEVCSYSYDQANTKFEWTAYKTSDKVGVKGSFQDIEVESEANEDAKKVIESLHFKMTTAKVSSGNEDRDMKISKHFFETINTPTISGQVKSVNDDGTAVISVTMNGVTKDVQGTYEMHANDFAFTASIDVSDWNAIPGIEALNKICKDLHTGADGVSKLWSEVGLSFSTSLISDCD